MLPLHSRKHTIQQEAPMPDTGIQKPLPYLSREARASPPDTHFPLAAERLVLRQRLESLQRLLQYQGGSPNALHVIIAIQDDQISHLRSYSTALEREIEKLCRRIDESGPPAASQPWLGTTPVQGPCPPKSPAAGGGERG